MAPSTSATGSSSWSTPARGHTDGDVVLRVEDADVLLAGDLVEESGHPAYGDDCWPMEWPLSLDLVLELVGPATVVVRGHGAPVDRDFVSEQRAAIGVVAETVPRPGRRGVPVDRALGEGQWPYPAEVLEQAVRRGTSTSRARRSGCADLTPRWVRAVPDVERSGVAPQQGWSKKRERQYEHIKEGLEDRGKDEDTTRGDRRAHRQQGARPRRGVRAGLEDSTDDISRAPWRPALALRGGRSHQGPALRGGQEENIEGRSSMSKDELEKAVDEKFSG